MWEFGHPDPREENRKQVGPECTGPKSRRTLKNSRLGSAPGAKARLRRNRSPQQAEQPTLDHRRFPAQTVTPLPRGLQQRNSRDEERAEGAPASGRAWALERFGGLAGPQGTHGAQRPSPAPLATPNPRRARPRAAREHAGQRRAGRRQEPWALGRVSFSLKRTPSSNLPSSSPHAAPTAHRSSVA
ncbi:unnamed protein product [Rangifer tarandus platyrhynchus]|uniref:Uncharacterized protein n=1 Tax=Rangifer tarandus platyrhynchus TaxID=3082113 RepID=A0ABN8YD83_RANTA|nr:unnamed protein product [Rangifer tarandus platyrhynchus]